MQKFVLTPELFEKMRVLLAESAGLQFDATKLGALQMQMRDRARARHSADLEAYYELLTDPETGPDELRKLLEVVTIHETSFFRNHEHFRALREIVLPTLAQRNAATRQLRIWSAGCSTGEEPYSLTITCLEQPQLAGWNIVIEATDLSERVLTFARRGKFRADALRYLEPDRIARWFTHQTQETILPGARRGTGPFDPIFGQREVFAVNDRIRKLVRFGSLNLAEPDYPDLYRDFDLVVCENVIIYFKPEVTRTVIDRFYERLRPGGYLFLGYSETLWQVSNRFQLITYPSTFFYRRPLEEAPAAAPPVPPRRIMPGPPDARRKLPEIPPPPRPAPPDISGPRLLGAPLRERPPSPAAPPVPAPRPAGADAAAALALAEQLIRQAHEHLEAGRYAEAQEAFQSALARNPSAVDALMGLAQIHANQGQRREARAACEKALEVDALCEAAHLLLALLARQGGQLDEAIDHFEKVLYINFETLTGHYHLAELYRTEGRFPEALREYRRALWALGRHHGDKIIDGLPAALIRQACEQQVRRLADFA